MDGELVFARIKQWLAQADALSAGPTIDLGRVTRIDSAGASLLLELTRRAARRGVKLEFVNPGPQVRGLLEFLEIDGVLALRS